MKNLDDNKLIFENYVKSRKTLVSEMALEPTGQKLEPEDLGDEAPATPAAPAATPSPTAPSTEGDVGQLIAQLRKLKATSGTEAVKAELEKIKISHPEKVREIAQILISQASAK